MIITFDKIKSNIIIDNDVLKCSEYFKTLIELTKNDQNVTIPYNEIFDNNKINKFFKILTIYHSYKHTHKTKQQILCNNFNDQFILKFKFNLPLFDVIKIDDLLDTIDLMIYFNTNEIIELIKNNLKIIIEFNMHDIKILEYLLQFKADDVFMKLCNMDDDKIPHIEELISIPIEKFKEELYEKHKIVLDKILDKKLVNNLIQIKNEHIEQPVDDYLKNIYGKINDNHSEVIIGYYDVVFDD